MPFLVECTPDYTLVEVLTYASKSDIVHAGNKSEVIKALVRHYENSKGIVDEDPGSAQPRYLHEFTGEKVFENYSIKVLQYPSRNNYLIILCPRLEDWVLQAARRSNVDVRSYGLPNDSSRLHKRINIQVNRFERLLRDLMRRSGWLKFLASVLRCETIDLT